MKEIELRSLGFAEGIIIGPTMPKWPVKKQADWEQIKRIIEENTHRLLSVEVGLAEDWDCTKGPVWLKDAGFVPRDDTKVYAASDWATPAVRLTYGGRGSYGTRDEIFECWIEKEDADPNSYFQEIPAE